MNFKNLSSAHINKGHMLIPVLFACSLIAPHIAEADVYTYVSDEGVVTFTDAPVHKDAVLIMRDTKPSNKSIKKHGSPATVALHTAALHSATGSQSKMPGSLMMPISGRITSAVGLRLDPFNGNLRSHEGIDIAVPAGTPVQSVASGIVTYSGTRNGYGNIVILEHDDGMVTLYAHNQDNLVPAGMRVDRGTIIALSGSTGRSTGPHLHFEAWYHGENITEDFLSIQSGMTSGPVVMKSAHQQPPARKIVMADGTILLTNLPLDHP